MFQSPIIGGSSNTNDANPPNVVKHIITLISNVWYYMRTLATEVETSGMDK